MIKCIYYVTETQAVTYEVKWVLLVRYHQIRIRIRVCIRARDEGARGNPFVVNRTTSIGDFSYTGFDNVGVDFVARSEHDGLGGGNQFEDLEADRVN